MKTNNLRKAIALLATICLLATIVIVPMSVSATAYEKWDATYHFGVEFSSTKPDVQKDGDYVDSITYDEIKTAKPGDTVYVIITVPFAKYNSIGLKANLAHPADIAEIGRDKRDRPIYFESYPIDGESTKLSTAMCNATTGYLEMNITSPVDTITDYQWCFETAACFAVKIPDGATNDPVTGVYGVIEQPDNISNNALNVNGDMYQDALKGAGIQIVNSDGEPIYDDAADFAPVVSGDANTTQTGKNIESLVGDDGTATMRFFFKAGNDGTEYGAYMLPMSAFVVGEDNTKYDEKTGYAKAEASINKGDFFAADYTGIPATAFDAPMAAIGFVKTADGYVFTINADENNTVNMSNITPAE